MLTDPVAKRGVNPCLPTPAACLEVVHHLRRKPDGGRDLGPLDPRPAATNRRLGERSRQAVPGKIRGIVTVETLGLGAFFRAHWFSPC